MSKSVVRKNNIAKAVIEFIVGAAVLAGIIFALNEFVLNKKYAEDVPPVDANPIVMDGEKSETADENEQQPVETADNEPVEPETENGFEAENETDVFGMDEDAFGGEDDSFAEEENFGEPEGEEPAEFGDVFGEVENGEENAEPENEPETEPDEPEETEPAEIVNEIPEADAAAVVPATEYAAVSKAAEGYKNWKLDKDTRVSNGISRFEVLTGENGGSVLSLTGWIYPNDKPGYNANDSQKKYVYVQNEAGQIHFYEVKQDPGASGVTHQIVNGIHMDCSDFSCNINVGGYPSGTYTLGSALDFRMKEGRYHFGYTFGEAYTFTVVNGIVTSVGGVEN